MNNIANFLERHKHDILEDLQALVAKQSPSHDKHAVDVCGSFLSELFQKRLGIGVEKFEQTLVGDNLLFKIGEGNHRSLLIGHFDTVWDIDRLGTRIENGKFYGPGAFDMKAGLVQGIWALKALQEMGALNSREVWFLCTSDEEIGSNHSRQLIEDIAKQCNDVFVLEPCEEGTGNLKIARKGVGNFFIKIYGKAAHAGNNPLGGISAAEEMAHQILWINSLQDLARGTSVNVGIATSGNRINVIPDFAEISIDVRVTSMDEAERIHTALSACKPYLAGAKVEMNGKLTRPPMEQNAGNKQLFDIALKAANNLGMVVGGSSVGGGSDGNFTSALNIPTLDGLGAEGGGPHAEYEHVIIDVLHKRAALLAEILGSGQ
ncbi:M20 family metallopeptidase (plasmid) [Bartonella sp. HY329]|uniref:M20 family metallopeptidase n=1 Tax=unclassified Bartonella TaxID=2645622 RepID=UPI0021C8E7E6|nr:MULTISPECIES: M20 family metallopeptidase [unclassified Bartonella]UXM96604.1 M20 family metallopeptidase [Bartonella sp. HY329]UXN10927.1 M20 family metallopeptidase [Bartonella sp. HY328]